MKIRRTIPAVLAALACALSAAAQSPQTSAHEPLTVMSFNIRYGTANDGDNHWTVRREFLLDVMREANADLVGLQEALEAQIAALLQALPQYGLVGVGRDDGRTRGEYASILYRRDRFRVSDAGTFWFSGTPEVVASRSWGTTSHASARSRRQRHDPRPRMRRSRVSKGTL
jgi:endonuclease/exonuclease/phosphatase family metal-dependent hydrolase